jgi:hypothetical protein
MIDTDYMNEAVCFAMGQVSDLVGAARHPEVHRFGSGEDVTMMLSYDILAPVVDILAFCRFRQNLHDRLYMLHGKRLGGLTGLTIEPIIDELGGPILQVQVRFTGDVPTLE